MRAPRRDFPTVLTALALVTVVAGSALAVDADLVKQARSQDEVERKKAAWELAADGSAEAAKLLRKLLTDPSTFVCDSTVEACVRLKSADALEEFMPLSRASQAWKRRNAVEAIGRSVTRFAMPVLLDGAKDADQSVRLAALGVLDSYTEFRGVEVVGLEASRSTDPVTRALAVTQLAGFKATPVDARVFEMLEDPDAGVRAAALSTLTARDIDVAMAAAPRFATAEDWRERVDAIFTCARSRSRDAVDLLVALAADDRRVVGYLAQASLRRVSRLDYDDDPEVWAAWWKGARDTWKPPTGDLRDVSPGGDDRYAQFHGLSVRSDHIVFVIDASTSMNEPMDTAGPKTRLSRWERTVQELTTVLDSLPAKTQVNVVLFGATVRPVFPEPRALTDRTRGELRKALGQRPYEDKTNVFGAMEAALTQDADTIYLLGDGAPNAGEAVGDHRVRRGIARLNAHARRRIHTIAIGKLEKWAVDMLKSIADDAGGSHTQRVR